MKQKNKNTQRKAFQVGTHHEQILATVPYTAEDFKNSLLIVSVLVNLLVFTTWLVTQVSGTYAQAVASLIVG